MATSRSRIPTLPPVTEPWQQLMSQQLIELTGRMEKLTQEINAIAADIRETQVRHESFGRLEVRVDSLTVETRDLAKEVRALQLQSAGWIGSAKVAGQGLGALWGVLAGVCSSAIMASILYLVQHLR